MLELLWTDFFCTHALWNDERATGNFPESLGEDLGVDDVPLDDIQVIVLSESTVHFTWVNLLRSFQEQAVFIKGHLDDCNVPGLSKTGHEITQGGVESTTSASGDHVGWESTADDLFDQDAT